MENNYIPATDEPSIFNGINLLPSAEWCLWCAYTCKVGIVQAHDVGVRLILQLTSEPPRTVDKNSTVMLSVTSPQFSKAGIKRPSLSMAWVIQQKYSLNLSWLEATAMGLIAMKGVGGWR